METTKSNSSKGKVPFVSKFAYGFGDVGCNFSWSFVVSFLMIFYYCCPLKLRHSRMRICMDM